MLFCKQVSIQFLSAVVFIVRFQSPRFNNSPHTTWQTQLATLIQAIDGCWTQRLHVEWSLHLTVASYSLAIWALLYNLVPSGGWLVSYINYPPGLYFAK